MDYVLFFVCLTLLSTHAPGYLIVQDDHSSSEDGHELGLKQRMDRLEANLAKLQETTEHRNNCSVHVHFWLGLTDTETEGIWRWYDDGSKAAYLGWVGTEPQDGGGAEDCVIFEAGQQYGWADVSCGSPYRALCEQKFKSA